MIQITAIDHIVLRTGQVPEMIKFYVDILGCTVERELPKETGLIQLRAGTALIDIVDVNGELGRPGGGPPAGSGLNLDHFCLQIEPFDEDRLLSWLADHGVESGGFKSRYGAEGFGPSIYISDPDGNTIELKAKKSRKS